MLLVSVALAVMFCAVAVLSVAIAPTLPIVARDSEAMTMTAKVVFVFMSSIGYYSL